MAKTPQVGEQAPDFELPGTDGPFRLPGANCAGPAPADWCKVQDGFKFGR